MMISDTDVSAMEILIVDDEQANIALLQYILNAAGYTRLRSTSDPRRTAVLYEESEPDLILLDLMMPFVTGFEIMGQLRQRFPSSNRVPILVLTADINTESKHQALLAGASDFLTKPFDQIEVLLRIRHLLQLRAQHLEITRQNDRLEDAVRERTGELRHALGQLEETVHQLRSTQQQVIQHERLSALGAMAAGLAHDFNNSLSLILGYSELLLSDLANTPYRARSDEFLGTVITAAQDAARMFSRLRSIFRQADHDQEWQPVQINSLVEHAAALTRPRWHGQALGQGVTIRLETVLAPGLPVLTADAAELRELLTNLIFNAVDAMPQGGVITLRTRHEPGPPEAVVLEVSDTGTGMDEETRRRCLEPFFTTKGQKGTGLGLAMVYGTMQRHGGAIDLQSTPGKGTTFTFRLPLQPQAGDQRLELPPLETQRPWRILVVDDQPVFINILRHYLANDLHTVETAADGHEALEKFQRRTFDLVITDNAMPHMNGGELAGRIKILSPLTRIILLTGYSAADEDGRPADPAIDATVIKPITHVALRAVISRTMAGYEPAVPVKAAKRRKRPVGVLQKLGL